MRVRPGRGCHAVRGGRAFEGRTNCSAASGAACSSSSTSSSTGTRCASLREAMRHSLHESKRSHESTRASKSWCCCDRGRGGVRMGSGVRVWGAGDGYRSNRTGGADLRQSSGRAACLGVAREERRNSGVCAHTDTMCERAAAFMLCCLCGSGGP